VGNPRGPEETTTKRKLKMITPMLAEMTGNFHVGLAALGSALGVGVIGMKASEAVGRNPGAATQILVQALISSALAEAIVFYALFLVK
jgi:F-type H+-transporting ATPase subunit c